MRYFHDGQNTFVPQCVLGWNSIKTALLPLLEHALVPSEIATPTRPFITIIFAILGALYDCWLLLERCGGVQSSQSGAVWYREVQVSDPYRFNLGITDTCRNHWVERRGLYRRSRMPFRRRRLITGATPFMTSSGPVKDFTEVITTTRSNIAYRHSFTSLPDG